MSIGQNSSPMMRYALARTGQPLLSDTVRSRRLSFFGHLHRTDPSPDHYRALQACILGPPDDWRRRIGCPRQSWLRTVEADLRPMNLRLATSKRRAQDRLAWRKLVTMATSTTRSWRRRRSCWCCCCCCCDFSAVLFLSVVISFLGCSISQPVHVGFRTVSCVGRVEQLNRCFTECSASEVTTLWHFIN